MRPADTTLLIYWRQAVALALAPWLAEDWEATAQRIRYREALEDIAGPPERPFLGYDGKIAARALDRIST